MYIPLWVLVVAAIVLFFVYRRIAKTEQPFAPYYVAITPKWYELLKDHGLVDGPDGWQQLLAKAKAASKEEGWRYHVLLQRFGFTVLKSDGEGELVYDNNRNAFHTSIDLVERIQELEINRPNEHPWRFCDFWIKWGHNGPVPTIDIGITTPELWNKVLMVGDNNDRLTLAQIPLDVFQMRCSDWSEQMKEVMAKLGWSIDKRHEDWKNDVIGHSEEVLDHKYFEVLHDFI